jgi:hypothetical protein
VCALANLKGKVKKLQTAIVQRGLIIKINQNQFYSKDQKRMITMYRILTPVYTFKKNRQEWKMEDFEILKTASITDVIFCLIDIYKAVSG